MKLTKRAVDQAKYQGDSHNGADGKRKWARHVLWDESIPGFGLRITPSGKKTFVLSYRAGSRKRLMTLGPYGALTVDQARERARRALGAVLDGGDPLASKQLAAKAETVSQLTDRYLAEHAEVRKKAVSVKNDRQMLRDYILPSIGNLRVAEVSRRDASRLHYSLKKTPYLANRVLALLSKMFNLAEKWDIRPDGSNPCRHVEKYQEQKRDRYLSQQEFAALFQAIARAEESGTESPHALTAVRLLILTGCRLREILHLRWEYVDLSSSVINLPDSKTGAKTVFLSPAAKETLAGTPRTVGCSWVIEGRKTGSHLSDLKGPWRRIKKQAKLEDVRIHDLRHSFAALGAGAGLSLPMIGKLLGHTQSKTTQRYAHLAAESMHAAANLVGEELEASLNKAKRSNVIPIRACRS